MKSPGGEITILATLGNTGAGGGATLATLGKTGAWGGTILATLGKMGAGVGATLSKTGAVGGSTLGGLYVQGVEVQIGQVAFNNHSGYDGEGFHKEHLRLPRNRRRFVSRARRSEGGRCGVNGGESIS